ncbi:MAG: DUF885 domain-containing protein [Steroidobacteraceae bacterium]|nr:DUF885 domain-containing protein [Steroidobacteraceae bacterium]
MTRFRIAATMLALVFSVAAVAAPLNAAWDAHVTNYIESWFAANPSSAVYAGRHEFDGRLPDFSAGALSAEAARLEVARKATAAFDPSGLDAARRIEREYLLSVIDESLFWRVEAKWPERNPSWYLGAIDPEIYLSKAYAPLETRMRAFITYANALPQATEQIRANLRPPLAAPIIDYGVNAFGGYADFFASDASKVYAQVEDVKLQAELAAALKRASDAARELADWLAAQRATATQDYAMGPKLFARMLEATEQVTVPLDRLEAIGRADMDRNLAALRVACEEFAPGVGLHACVERVSGRKAADGPVAEARRQLPELRSFVVQHDLVSIPSQEQALVEQAPPYNAQNFAYIVTPGPYEKNLPAVYYIAPPDPRWSREEQEKYVMGVDALLFTSVHEVWPGHFLQFLHSNASKSRIGQLFVGYAYAEGWAHYTEEMMWDAGLDAGKPAAHIGQIVQALKRNARYLSAIGLHTRGMTVAQSEKLFLDGAFLDPGNARQQALRGTYDPAYLNYTLGKLMILKLRGDWVATRGDRKAWKAFHDQFLSYGGPPLPMVRRLMLGDAAGDPL